MKAKQTHRDEPSVATLLAIDILDLLESEPGSIAAETEEMHPADLADVVEKIPRSQAPAFFAALPVDRAAGVLEYLNEELRVELLEEMSPAQAAKLIGQMTPDDRVDTLDEIDEDLAEEIVDALPEADRRVTQQLLVYAADTAGGLMTTEFVSVPETDTVEVALRLVREIARGGRREAMNVVYSVDDRGILRGVLSLRELLAAPEGARVSDVAWTEVRHVHPSSDREEVARVISEYDLVAVPVVDDSERVLGVVTVDDVIDAIQEEQTEDVQKMGGMEALDEPYMQMSMMGMLKKRAGWLSILMISELFTTSALAHYETELDKLKVLVLFIPLVMSSGGNSGSQATSLITRAMALKEVELRDWWRVALRELPTGIVLGAILGAIGFLRIVIWQQLGIASYSAQAPYLMVATGIFFALVGIVTFGSLCGSMLPFLLRRLGFDPASSSAPFVATLVDVTGLIIYFSVALLFLGRYMV